jgi:pimeloyl-ACP methyl ester carboxylesterase
LNICDILSFHPPSYVSGVIFVTAPYVATILSGGTYDSFGPLSGLFTLVSVPDFQTAANTFGRILFMLENAPPYNFQRALVGEVMHQPRHAAIHTVTRTQDATALLAYGKEGTLKALVIDAKEDAIVKPGTIMKTMGEWKDLEVVEIAGSGHMPFMEKPVVFREEVLKWIAKCPKK